jgi:Protein of unknown function (DUF3422)
MSVMAVLVTAIQSNGPRIPRRERDWMPATSAGMTEIGACRPGKPDGVPSRPTITAQLAQFGHSMISFDHYAPLIVFGRAGDFFMPDRETPYTDQYKTIMGTGHTRPTQEIGAPTLIWHVAVWPKDDHDPQDVKPVVEPFSVRKLAKRRRRDSRSKKRYPDAIKLHNKRRYELLIKRRKQGTLFSHLRKLFALGPGWISRNYRTIVGGQKDPRDEPSKKREVETLNDLLSHLKEKGRTIRGRERGEGTADSLSLKSLLKEDASIKASTNGKRETSLQFSKPETIGFTLWWQDGPPGNQRATEYPGYDPLRVRVQVETQIDYFAITFLIDVGNPWNIGQVFSAKEAPGERRKKIFRYVEEVRGKCDGEFGKKDGSLEESLVPLDRVSPPSQHIPDYGLEHVICSLKKQISDKSVSKEQTRIFLEAAKYLYAGVWNEFCKSFDFNFQDIPGEQGRVFANFRGLVMSTPGADVDDTFDGDYLNGRIAGIRRGSATPGKSDFRKFNDKKNEPNAVVKAYWPFIRRIKPYADYREYIACGVFDWRALYITALGSQSEYDSGDESIGRDYEIPSGNLPELGHQDDDTGERKVWMRREGDPPLADDPILGPRGEEPVRYLLLTKYEPHRRQLGRIIDRINALGTMRLFALKSYDHIRDASEHIRMRGQELDQIVATWIDARRGIESKFGHDPDKRNAALSTLNELVELQLIEIAAGLDNLGKGTIGGLPYRIARSRYFAERFNAMRDTLEVRNIQSWTSYNQFATRGLQPVFDFIESTGHRLRQLRQRLANVMQTIQTSALVSQSEETRKNTRELEKLQAKARGLTIAAILGILIGFLQLIGRPDNFIDRVCAASGQICPRLFEVVREIFKLGNDQGAQIALALCIAGAFVAVVLMRQIVSRRYGFVFLVITIVGTETATSWGLIESRWAVISWLLLVVWVGVHLVWEILRRRLY